MKRAVARAKRKKAGTGAKRKAPRRRATAKTAAASPKTRRPVAQRKRVLKVKPARTIRVAAKRRIPRRKPRLKVPVLLLEQDELISATSSSFVEEKGFNPDLAEVSPVAKTPSRAAKSSTKTARPRTGAKSKSTTTAGAHPQNETARLDRRHRAERRAPSRPVGQTTSQQAEAMLDAPVLGKVKPRLTPLRKLGLNIPAILLEGDEPELPAISGPGEKFALGPDPPPAHFATEPTHLPATYGTGRLFLTARDPHWLYAHWDIHTTTQFRHNAKSVDRHLVLRMHEGNLHNVAVKEIHVHPESRHWFAHVEGAGKQYFADLGYYQAGHQWKSLATSAPMRTPPDTVSTDSTVEFATIPLEIPFETMLALLEEDVEEKLPLAQGVEQLRARRRREFQPPAHPAVWTPEQSRALEEILAAGRSQRALRGSQEIIGPAGELPSGGGSPSSAGQFDVSSFFGGETISSPHGGDEKLGQDFWFNINAELIIYGATEPNAKITIGGRPIALRPDGSFNYRFALPDGQYELPIVAVSADDTDARAAELKFTRATKLLGDVGAQPHDPALKPPTPENA